MIWNPIKTGCLGLVTAHKHKSWFPSVTALIYLAPYGRQKVNWGTQRLCRSFSGIHSPCYLAQSLGWENALCFIKPISSAAPGGTMLASHWGLSVCKTQEGRCLLEQYRCWPGWYLLKQRTGCNWLLSADFALTDIQLLQLQTLSQAFFRAQMASLITLQQILPVSHQHHISFLDGSLKLHQLLSWHR